MLRKRNEFRDHHKEVKLFQNRALVAFIGIIILLGGLVANLYTLQVKHFKDYQTRSNDNRIKILPIAPTRGLIYDRNGVLLAENQPVYNLEMIPEQAGNPVQLIEKLQQYIELTPEQIASFNKRYKHTRRFRSVIILNELNDEQVARFSVHQHEFNGVFITAELKRYYPFGEKLTHVLGYVAHINDRDIKRLKKEGKAKNYQATRNIGKLGIERYYEELLHGTKGYEEVEVNSHGRIIRTIRYVPPVAGKDIVLNLDIELQQYVFEQLDNRQGSAVVLDPEDNSIIAMVSSPSYDPNLFVNGISGKAYRALLNNPAHPLVNRATLGVYPPASTVKPFMAIAGLQEKAIQPDTIRNDHGIWRLPGSKSNSKAWRDWKRWGHGPVDVTKAIEESVDSFFYQMAFDLGIDRISTWMNKFGFGLPTGIDIHEESSANMPTREWKVTRHRTPWYQGDTVPIGIGQGYWTATPIQIAKATSFLVNHGHMKSPHLLKSIIEHGEDFANQDPVKTSSLPPITGVSDKYWNISINAMRMVNHGKHGSGRRAFKGTQYLSGGKSGTAQVFGLKKDQVYNSKKLANHLLDHALFTAFAPYDKPKYVATVVIEHGNGGSKVGAPFIRNVFDHLLVEPKSSGLQVEKKNAG
ncbi:penicillin-binding protein 2 [Vibrio sagamiensis]|uniref:Peptidoglycan D,D-transpeptidase MrdA n=1 Tax=Vibrio sagamiensis NBRC 104589 TaxID=1219064 RepID=A0A511Q9R3_9VIBR|nr:penicillin-binding protein 2 [Vibrio sagamiensis]PNQ71411.1 penicillin-binding protein 2 [Vibrio agarivorans]GEM74004.1 penicillin-binding protein 2 [Vibrio sagamiensis NBRC 104589]